MQVQNINFYGNMNPKTKDSRLVDYIYEIYQKIGERPAGSREEKLAARHIKSIFGQFSPEVSIETFKCIARRKQHLRNLACISYALALFAYLLYPPAAIIIICLTVISYILINFNDIDIFAIFFPTAKSQNVIARFKPKAESKKILIFSANIDSPYVVRLFEGKTREYAFLIRKIFTGLFILLFIISLFRTLEWLPSVIDYLYLLPLAGLGLAVYFQTMTVTYDKSFGANDNLSGIAILLGLAKYFSENKLENTEVCLCAFGAEETGLAGSKFFVKTHYKEIKEKARILNITSVAGGALYVVTSEYDTGIKHNKAMIRQLCQAAKNSGIAVYEKALEGISTGAGPFSFEKIPSVALLSLDKYGIPLRYHVKEDLPQYISEEQLQDVYKICIETAELTDERQETNKTE